MRGYPLTPILPVNSCGPAFYRAILHVLPVRPPVLLPVRSFATVQSSKFGTVAHRAVEKRKRETRTTKRRTGPTLPPCRVSHPSQAAFYRGFWRFRVSHKVSQRRSGRRHDLTTSRPRPHDLTTSRLGCKVPKFEVRSIPSTCCPGVLRWSRSGRR